MKIIEQIWKQNEFTHRSRRRRWHPSIMALTGDGVAGGGRFFVDGGRGFHPLLMDGVAGGIHDLLMSANDQKIGEMYLSK